MASVSASHLIIFIASVVIAAGVAGTLTSEVNRLSQSIDDLGVDLSNDIRTDVEIISDEGSEDAAGNNTAYTASASDGDGNLTIHLKNTGARSLPSNSDNIDVFLDGRYLPDFTVTVIQGSDWQVGGVVRLEIDTGSISPGDHRLKVIVGTDEEVFEFRLS